MIATNKSTKQKGFFTAGIGLALFAVFSAIGTGITMVAESDEHHNARVETQSGIGSISVAENKLENELLR